MRLSPCSIGLREQTFPRSSGAEGPACRRMASALVMRFNPVYPRLMRFGPHRGKEESSEMCRVLRAISVVCAFGWFANALLHLLLLIGMPLGAFVLGGKFTVIPVAMRPINLLLMVLWSLCGWSYLAYGGVIFHTRRRCLRPGLIIMTVLLLLASVFNIAVTSSPTERYATGTLSVVMVLLSAVLLLGSSGHARTISWLRCGTP